MLKKLLPIAALALLPFLQNITTAEGALHA